MTIFGKIKNLELGTDIDGITGATISSEAVIYGVQEALGTTIEKYDKKAGIGTLISTMLPYSIVFFILWSILLIIWIVFNLPLGPGAGLYYG